jgi:uncharacterized protein (UPF0548 family)
MFLTRRPSPFEIQRFIEASRGLSLSYDPVGLANQHPDGFAVDEQVALVGEGLEAFERAKAALADWRHFALGWVELFPADASVAAGTVVAVVVHHLGFWSMNGCRIVYGVGSHLDLEFGFAYGTLTNHAESGEEIFKVSFDHDTARVTYSIRAVSRPRAPLARLGYPVTRSLQARFRRDSARALARAVASPA